MKISLITPTYNSEKTLADTIESVVVQTEIQSKIQTGSHLRGGSFPAEDLEYIIIDGDSKDNTKKIISDYQGSINIKLISEPDKGIFDAMNKGIKMATGDIVGILNSDDFFYSPNILSKISNTFESNLEIDAIYGDLIYVDNDNIKKQTRYWKAGEYEESKLNWGWSIPHPTFFVRRKIYEKMQIQDGKIFDTSFVTTGCYELTFRLLKIHKIKVKYIPEILVTMRDGGTSASSLKNRIIGWIEQRRVWKSNSLRIPLFFITRRLLNKLIQFIIRPN